MKHSYIFVFMLLLSVSGCKKNTLSHQKLNIVIFGMLDSGTQDEKKPLPEWIKKLCAVYSADSAECIKSVVLDPTLHRLDNKQVLSLITKLENGFSNPNNPIFAQNKINNNFKEIFLSKEFDEPSKRKITYSETEFWHLSNTKNDSILVYSTNDSLTSYSMRGKLITVHKDIDSLRRHILRILCQNTKADITVFYNPVAKPPLPPKHDSTKTHRPPRSPRRPIITVIPSGPKGICNPVTHSLHELIYDEDDQPQYGKVLVMNCKECGYTGNN